VRFIATTRQTMEARLADFLNSIPEGVQVQVVVDEAHGMGAAAREEADFRRILQQLVGHPKVTRLLGFTASPWHDASDVAALFRHVVLWTNNRLLAQEARFAPREAWPLIATRLLLEAVRSGTVLPLRSVTVLDAAEQNGADPRSANAVAHLLTEYGRLRADLRRQARVSSPQEARLTQAFQRLVEHLVEELTSATWRRGIIIVDTIEAAEALQEALSQAFGNGVGVETVTSRGGATVMADRLRWFRSREGRAATEPRLVIAVDILREGVDFPELDWGALLLSVGRNPTTNTPTFGAIRTILQALGRFFRVSPGKLGPQILWTRDIHHIMADVLDGMMPAPRSWSWDLTAIGESMGRDGASRPPQSGPRPPLVRYRGPESFMRRAPVPGVEPLQPELLGSRGNSSGLLGQWSGFDYSRALEVVVPTLKRQADRMGLSVGAFVTQLQIVVQRTEVTISGRGASTAAAQTPAEWVLNDADLQTLSNLAARAQQTGVVAQPEYAVLMKVWRLFAAWSQKSMLSGASTGLNIGGPNGLLRLLVEWWPQLIFGGDATLSAEARRAGIERLAASPTDWTFERWIRSQVAHWSAEEQSFFLERLAATLPQTGATSWAVLKRLTLARVRAGVVVAGEAADVTLARMVFAVSNLRTAASGRFEDWMQRWTEQFWSTNWPTDQVSVRSSNPFVPSATPSGEAGVAPGVGESQSGRPATHEPPAPVITPSRLRAPTLPPTRSGLTPMGELPDWGEAALVAEHARAGRLEPGLSALASASIARYLEAQVREKLNLEATTNLTADHWINFWGEAILAVDFNARWPQMFKDQLSDRVLAQIEALYRRTTLAGGAAQIAATAREALVRIMALVRQARDGFERGRVQPAPEGHTVEVPNVFAWNGQLRALGLVPAGSEVPPAFHDGSYFAHHHGPAQVAEASGLPNDVLEAYGQLYRALSADTVAADAARDAVFANCAHVDRLLTAIFEAIHHLNTPQAPARARGAQTWLADRSRQGATPEGFRAFLAGLNNNLSPQIRFQQGMAAIAGYAQQWRAHGGATPFDPLTYTRNADAAWAVVPLVARHFQKEPPIRPAPVATPVARPERPAAPRSETTRPDAQRQDRERRLERVRAIFSGADGALPTAIWDGEGLDYTALHDVFGPHSGTEVPDALRAGAWPAIVAWANWVGVPLWLDPRQAVEGLEAARSQQAFRAMFEQVLKSATRYLPVVRGPPEDLIRHAIDDLEQATGGRSFESPENFMGAVVSGLMTIVELFEAGHALPTGSAFEHYGQRIERFFALPRFGLRQAEAEVAQRRIKADERLNQSVFFDSLSAWLRYSSGPGEVDDFAQSYLSLAVKLMHDAAVAIESQRNTRGFLGSITERLASDPLEKAQAQFLESLDRSAGAISGASLGLFITMLAEYLPPSMRNNAARAIAELFQNVRPSILKPVDSTNSAELMAHRQAFVAMLAGPVDYLIFQISSHLGVEVIGVRAGLDAKLRLLVHLILGSHALRQVMPFNADQLASANTWGLNAVYRLFMQDPTPEDWMQAKAARNDPGHPLDMIARVRGSRTDRKVWADVRRQVQLFGEIPTGVRPVLMEALGVVLDRLESKRGSRERYLDATKVNDALTPLLNTWFLGVYQAFSISTSANFQSWPIPEGATARTPLGGQWFSQISPTMLGSWLAGDAYFPAIGAVLDAVYSHSVRAYFANQVWPAAQSVEHGARSLSKGAGIRPFGDFLNGGVWFGPSTGRERVPMLLGQREYEGLRALNRRSEQAGVHLMGVLHRQWSRMQAQDGQNDSGAPQPPAPDTPDDADPCNKALTDTNSPAPRAPRRRR
jgi:hypothetical protein